MNSRLEPDDIAPELPREGPGSRLRTTREAKGLGVDQIANELHLTRDTVTALEANNEERLPAPVFVRGYLRNYARLLGLDEAPILDAYRPAIVQQQPPKQSASSIKLQREIRSNHLGVRLVTWLIVVGLLVSLGIWFKEELRWTNVQQEVEQATGQIQGDIDLSNLRSELTLPPSGDSPPPSLKRELAIQETPAEDEPAAVSLTETPLATESERPIKPLETATQPLRASATAAEDRSAETAAPAVTEATTPTIPSIELEPLATVVDATTGVVLQFADSCWVEIRDRNGEIVLIGNMRPGSSRHLTGLHPFKITLGNSPMVSLTIDGSPFDITPFSRGNVARFELDPVTRQGTR